MNKQDETLLEAIHDGDVSAVKDCLRRGADPNALQGGDSNDPFIFAAFSEFSHVFPPSYRGDRAESFYGIDIDGGVLEVLRAAGANPNVRNGDGDTPLTVAVDWMNLEAVQSLLDSGADPNLADGDGRTPLLVAARWTGSDPSSVAEQAAMIRLLLGRGACVDAQSHQGETALISAVANTNGEIVKLLLDFGANRTIADVADRTATQYAETIQDPVRRELILSMLG